MTQSSSSIPLDRLLRSPESINIDGRQYVLEVYLWRDTAPSTQFGGSPLIALIRVNILDSRDFPKSITADLLWVIKDKQVWEMEFSNEDRPEPPSQLEKIARNGPRWEPGSHVDVVVQLYDRKSNHSFLLKAVNQVIRRIH